VKINFQKFRQICFQLIILLSAFQSLPAKANIDWLCERVKMEVCDQRRFTRSGGASIPSESNSYRLNPSSVSIEKGFGFEVVGADHLLDYGLVTGNGKVGAAISPTSLEDTFFANIPLEDTDDYIARKQNERPYRSNKYTFATATQIIKKNKFINPSVGIILKYNQLSKKTSPGAGFNLGLGPLSFGYAVNKDDFYKDYTYIVTHIRYTTKTFTIGAKLPNFAIDYSRVDNEISEVADTRIIILSATLFWRNFMFTYGTRQENSYRPEIDPETKIATTADEKNAAFLGIQYAINKKILLGLFNNYFLNNELSIGLTSFF
jgi:hypothetical protein